MTRTIARLSAALLAAALVAVAAPASAHVTVSSTDAAPGGYGKVTFRVPTESDTASTTKLVVTLPADTPFAFVTAGAKPGWDVEMTEAELDEPTKAGDATLTKAVRTVTWTATGDGVAPGQFDEFSLSGGPFPDADEIVFAAEQTYDDGEVVDWAQVPAGEAEPEHPAPTLALSAPVDAAATDDASSSETDALPRWLSGGALVVAAAALLVALRQNRRRA
jgi:uncharacterized protein YcnI